MEDWFGFHDCNCWQLESSSLLFLLFTLRHDKVVAQGYLNYFAKLAAD